MTLLTKLELSHCEPAGGQDCDTSGFLAVLRDMRQLQHLAVYNYLDALLEAADPRACAALTASSQLTCLQISDEEIQPLPATALRHMFPAGKQLPRLQLLEICSEGSEDAGLITAAELSSLVDACPGLTCLDLTGVLAPDAGVSALLKLPQQCQHVAVGGQAFCDEAAEVVAQLTQLKSLRWTGAFVSGAHSLTHAGLAQLTALHTLDTLHIRHVNLNGDSTRQHDSVSLEATAGEQVRSMDCTVDCCRQSQSSE
jgi:hypothetical protein